MPIAAVDVNMAEQFRPMKVFSAIVRFENRDYYYAADQRAKRSHAFNSASGKSTMGNGYV